jgi:hypothetical protein
MAFSAVTARGSNTSNTNGTTLSVSPSANLLVDEIVFFSVTTDNIATVDGASTNHSVADSQGNTWNKVFEVTETDGAGNDGSTTSLWWSRISTQIGTGDSVTATFSNTISDKVISLVEVTVGAGKTVAFETGYTASVSGTSLSHTLSGLTSREYLFFGLFGAEGEDTAKTPTTNYTEQFDLVSSTAGAADANCQQHVQTRILTATSSGAVSSTAVTFTSGIQSVTGFYEIDAPVNVSVVPTALTLEVALNSPTVATEINNTFTAEALSIVSALNAVTVVAVQPNVTVLPTVLSTSIVLNSVTVVTAGAPPSTILDGLVSAYKLDENGSAIDSHGTNDGTNTDTTLVTGRVEGALSYNGTTSISLIPHDVSLDMTDRLTLIADIYPTAIGQSSVSQIFCKLDDLAGGGGQEWGIGFNASQQIRFRIAGSVDYTPTQTLALNQWHRVIARYERNVLRDVTINGTVNTGTNVSTTIEPVVLDAGIGAQPSTGGGTPLNRRFTGYIDNVFLYNRAITNVERDYFVNNIVGYDEISGGSGNVTVLPTVLSINQALNNVTVVPVRNNTFTATPLSIVSTLNNVTVVPVRNNTFTATPLSIVSTLNNVTVVPVRNNTFTATTLSLSVVSQSPVVSTVRNNTFTATTLSLSVVSQSPVVSTVRNNTFTATPLSIVSTLNNVTVVPVRNNTFTATTLSTNLALNAPTVSTAGSVIVTPNILSLVGVLGIPTINTVRNSSFTATSLSVSTALNSPTVSTIRNNTYVAESLTLTTTANSATVATAGSTTVIPTLLSISGTLGVPIINTVRNNTFTATPLSIVSTINNVTVVPVRNNTFTAESLGLGIVLNAPTVNAVRNSSFIATSLSVSATLSSPTVSTVRNNTFVAESLNLTGTLNSATVATAGSTTVIPTLLSIVGTLVAPTVSTVRNNTFVAQSLLLTKTLNEVTVSTTRNVTVVAQSLLLTKTLNEVTVSTTRNVTVSTSTLNVSLSTLPVTVISGGGVIVNTNTLNVSLSTLPVTVNTTRNVTVSADRLGANVSSLSPNILTQRQVTYLPEVLRGSINLFPASVVISIIGSGEYFFKTRTTSGVSGKNKTPASISLKTRTTKET